MNDGDEGTIPTKLAKRIRKVLYGGGRKKLAETEALFGFHMVLELPFRREKDNVIFRMTLFLPFGRIVATKEEFDALHREIAADISERRKERVVPATALELVQALEEQQQSENDALADALAAVPPKGMA